MKKIFKIILFFSAVALGIFIALFCYFFVGRAPAAQNITWGVDFSQMHTEQLKLDWKEVYLAILDDLGAKNIKIHTQWDWVEGKRNDYFFDDIDWQLSQAEKRGAKIIYVVGMKTGRWPECHLPAWARGLGETEQQKELLQYISKIIARYKDSKAILYWQVENEPLFKFGDCPAWYYGSNEFLKKEVALVRSIDPSRQIIVSDSGEQSLWFGAAKTGDIVGTTMYRKVWFHINDLAGFYVNVFLSPVYYWRKAEIIKDFFGKKVICIELQAEPWAQKVLYEADLAEQEKTMNLEQFKKNVEYAKQTGLDTFYFWGVEWWYWMKTVQNRPEIWNAAKALF